MDINKWEKDPHSTYGELSLDLWTWSKYVYTSPVEIHIVGFEIRFLNSDEIENSDCYNFLVTQCWSREST